MNGPQHYKRAQWLIDQGIGESEDEEHATRLAATAQVHAILALTAAFIEAQGLIWFDQERDVDDVDAIDRVETLIVSAANTLPDGIA